MRHAPVRATLVAGVCLAIVSCSPPSQPAQTRQADIEAEYRPTGTIKDIMDSIVDPSADVIWESVAEILTAAGTEERRPHTDDEWKTVRRAAIRILEATNLVQMPGREVARSGEKAEHPGIELPPEEIARLIAGDRSRFISLAHGLHDAAREALTAIDAHDGQSLFTAGEHLDRACESCHLVYWYPPGKAPVGGGSVR